VITMDMILAELKKYNPNACTMFPGASDDDIADLEDKIGYMLPYNFKEFLKQCNGLGLTSETIYGIHTKRHLDLFDNYICEKDEAGNPIWSHLLPISPDGFGNHYCLDLNTLTEDKSECKVIFWQHDYEFSKDDPPDVDAETFLDFVWKVLMFVKELSNYDGTDK
jgi:cell wall assembly regulator SMI1